MTTRRQFIKTLALGAAASLAFGERAILAQAPSRKPNFVIIFIDDQGYADGNCFGSKHLKTPNIDRMAEEGTRFTDFYAAAPSCTPSRAALMTGCYPQRVSLPNVLSPRDKIGINAEEMTIADMLKPQGYATACYGKWHLGHHKPFLPTHHGFDEYFGLPYSNDMWPKHPQHPENYPDLPLIEGDEVVQVDPDQNQLTTWYTEHAVKFIEANKDNPFFLYVPHSMVHVPLHVSDKFKGKSGQGLFGDVIMEVDWSVGQILDTLKRLGLDENTLVIYSSDNGPWLSYGDHAGSAMPLREGKGTTFDGGQREPCIMRWPGRIPAGRLCKEPCSTIDVLPTLAHLAGAALPKDRVIDGANIWPVVAGEAGATCPREAFCFYRGNRLEAIRSGKWKLHLPHQYRHCPEPGSGGTPGDYVQKKIDRALFNLEEDIAEEKNVVEQFPEVADRLEKMAKAFDKEMKANRRDPGKVDA